MAKQANEELWARSVVRSFWITLTGTIGVVIYIVVLAQDLPSIEQLENFDPVGRWRDGYENGHKVDASGVLFRKHEFKGVVEFKDAILSEKDRFTRAFAGHMLSFALGRGLAPIDVPALDQITEKTVASGYQLQTLIHEVVQSAPFVSRPRVKTASANPPKNGIKTTR